MKKTSSNKGKRSFFQPNTIFHSPAACCLCICICIIWKRELAAAAAAVAVARLAAAVAISSEDFGLLSRNLEDFNSIKEKNDNKH